MTTLSFIRNLCVTIYSIDYQLPFANKYDLSLNYSTKYNGVLKLTETSEVTFKSSSFQKIDGCKGLRTKDVMSVSETSCNNMYKILILTQCLEIKIRCPAVHSPSPSWAFILILSYILCGCV